MTVEGTVLHIGADKTGTTAIQLALAARRSELIERGVWYPDLDGRPDHRLLASKPRIPLRSPTGAETLVLSSEGLWSLDGRVIAELVEALPAGPLTVVGYLRDPVAHAEAAFGQRLRLSRSERELAALFALRSLPAAANPIVSRSRRRLLQLERWVDAVDAAGRRGGREPAPRLLVRPYEPSVDVVTDLCRAVGLDRVVALVADRDDPRPNAAPGLLAIHASVLVRQRSGPQDQIRFLDAVAARRLGLGCDGGADRVGLLPPALRRRIHRRTEPLLDRLARRIGGFEPPTAAAADRPGSDRSALDRDAARALLEEIWPGFPGGAPDPSN